MKRFLLISCVLMLVLFSIKGQGSDSDTANFHFASVINEEGHVLIEWSYDEPDSIDGFIVYYKNPNKDPDPGLAFDTISKPLAISFVDSSGKANISSVHYSVASFIEEGGIKFVNAQTHRHATIFLEPDWQGCSSSVKLNWTPYTGWGVQDMYYRVFENNILIDSTTDTYYYITNAENNIEYQYRIEALNKNTGWTSSSNYVSINTNFPEPTDYLNADFATVQGDAIFLSFTLGDNGNDYDYILLAKPPGSQIFSDTLTTYTYASQMNYEYGVADVTQPYQFKLIERDTCGRYGNESNISSNIVLKYEENNGTIDLNWNEYRYWPVGVESYYVYRSIGSGFEEIGVSSNTLFQDDVSRFIDDYGILVIRYFVEARKTSVNQNPNQYISRSNTIEIYPERPLNFPTAFTPNDDGTNDIFRPIDFSESLADYSMLIFDRWGKKVFESTRVDDGWDGKFASGKRVAEGVYHYYVAYKDLAGNERKQTGIITVLYP